MAEIDNGNPPKGFNYYQELNVIPTSDLSAVKAAHSISTQIKDKTLSLSDKRLVLEAIGLGTSLAVNIFTTLPSARDSSLVGISIFTAMIAENVINRINLLKIYGKLQNKMMKEVWMSLPESRRQEIISFVPTDE